nr:MAG TPA: hypothetical protein [Caudoviricetes sp.]
MEGLTLEEAIKYIKEVVRKNRKNKEKNTIVIPNSFISSTDCAEKYEQVAKWLEELKSYKEAEEQGLLVRLPCKVGDSVFIIVGKDVSKQGIRKIEISDNSIIFKTNRQKRIFNVSEFEKSVFLTREEAVNKLEEMKNGKK